MEKETLILVKQLGLQLQRGKVLYGIDTLEVQETYTLYKKLFLIYILLTLFGFHSRSLDLP